ncbi:TATA box-binding protein-associated factor RNA polymerase I subunit D isoform X2 [Ranitomeya variabilis]|uniref:TATA box-binding protein-associated factor RNA polymerase I subunit D isoform X2 n=1 Tax=Ranitomeya variabilis TaxID=490064 RepID=UPI004056430C
MSQAAITPRTIMDSSVALPMDQSPGCEPSQISADSAGNYCRFQALNSDSIQGGESENPSVTASSTEDDTSLFQDAVSCAPTRTTRRHNITPLSSTTSDDSSDSDLSSRNLPLSQQIAEYLKNPFRRHSKRKRQKSKKKKKKKRPAKQSKSPRVTARRPFYSIPLEERKRRLIDKGIPFPCAPLKYLPFKQYFEYEQHVLGGFLNHIKDLKYENTLKSSLKDMSVDEDGESEDFQMRKYSYLDEDGSLSPISEPGENLEGDEAEEEVKVVENSEFILDCQVPSKKMWQIKLES